MNRRTEVGRENRRLHWEREEKEFAAEILPRPATPPGMPALRSKITSRTGKVVMTDEPLWTVHRDFSKRSTVRLNVDRLYRPWALGIKRPSGQLSGIPRRSSIFSEKLIHACLLYLARSIEKHSGGSAISILEEFAAIESFLASRPDLRNNTEVDTSNLSAVQYLAFVREGNCRGALPRFYKWCVGRGLAGFEPGEMRKLRQITIPKQSRGIAIRSRDPKKGALAWQEQQMLMAALRSPADQTAPRDQLVVWLFFELGARPVAVGQLRNRHFHPTPLRDGYTVDVPKAKQNGPTEETVKRKISKALGDLAVSVSQGDPNDYLLDVSRGWATAACRRFAEANDLKTPRVPENHRSGEEQPGRRALHARLNALEANLARLQRLEERGIPIHERQLEQAREAIDTIRRRLTSQLPVLSATGVGN